MRLRLIFLVCLLCLTPLALANAAMGLGLEMYDLRYWAIYVVVTVVLEAWIIGRWMGLGFFKSIGVSVGANLVTAMLCPNLFAPLLHQSWVGTTIDPNPFGGAISSFAIFGVLSGLAEAAVWTCFRVKSEEPKKQRSILLGSLLAHLVGIPIGLAIVLIPPRPYVALEGFASASRRLQIPKIARSFVTFDDHEQPVFITAATLEELLRQQPEPEDSRLPPSRRFLAFYPAVFGRFSTGTQVSDPHMDWNADLSGKRLDQVTFPAWTFRWRDPRTGACFGYEFLGDDEAKAGKMSWTTDARDLGY